MQLKGSKTERNLLNRCNNGANGFFNTYRNIDEDIFEDIDEEYVNESTK